MDAGTSLALSFDDEAVETIVGRYDGVGIGEAGMDVGKALWPVGGGEIAKEGNV